MAKSKKAKKSKPTKRAKRVSKTKSLAALLAAALEKIENLAKNVTLEEPVKVAEPEVRSMKVKLLDELEEALQGVPDGARGTGMSVIIENNEVKTVKYSTKQEALDLIARARKNEISLVF